MLPSYTVSSAESGLCFDVGASVARKNAPVSNVDPVHEDGREGLVTLPAG